MKWWLIFQSQRKPFDFTSLLDNRFNRTCQRNQFNSIWQRKSGDFFLWLNHVISECSVREWARGKKSTSNHKHMNENEKTREMRANWNDMQIIVSIVALQSIWIRNARCHISPPPASCVANHKRDLRLIEPSSSGGSIDGSDKMSGKERSERKNMSSIFLVPKRRNGMIFFPIHSHPLAQEICIFSCCACVRTCVSMCSGFDFCNDRS